MLEIKNVTKSYRKNKGNLVVLDNVSYTFENGKFYCISGKSGAGKSTLIQMLGLLINPNSGEILIDNKKVSDLSDDARANMRNKKIGFIFQSFYLDPLMKSYENVMLPMYLNKNYTIKKMKKLSTELLKLVDLEDRANHYPKELSGGEKQRVAIARALANNPDIILADEPTGSLDPENEEKILKILKYLASKGKCVIVVSHSRVVKDFADEVLLIKDHTLLKESKNEK